MATVTRRRMIFANADVRHLAAKWIFLLLFIITMMRMRMKMAIMLMSSPRSKVKRSIVLIISWVLVLYVFNDESTGV